MKNQKKVRMKIIPIKIEVTNRDEAIYEAIRKNI